MNLYAVRQLVAESDTLTEELRLLPTGCMITHRRGTHTYYALQYHIAGKQVQKYIRKADQPILAAQMQRRKEIRLRLEEIRKLLKHHCRLIHRVRKEQRQAKDHENKRLAARAAADELPFGEHCLHRTLRGEYVASKSEVLLADYYYLHGIHYLYSKPLRLEGRTYYPDFLICVHGRQIYHEHLGALEDPDYARRWQTKCAVYRRNGIIEQHNLICTRDKNGTIDMSEIDQMFQKWGIIQSKKSS